MGTFLLALFIIFIVIPIARVVWSVYRLRSQARSAFRRFEQDMRGQAEDARRDARPGGWRSAPAREKKISREQGEYVEWEEVAVTETSVGQDASSGPTETRFESEQQIVDVEWEDVK